MAWLPSPDDAALIERVRMRPILEAENALHQAIFLVDDLSARESRDHPSGPDFTTHYVVPHGLWAAVLRERQNLRHAIQTTLWPDSIRASNSQSNPNERTP